MPSNIKHSLKEAVRDVSFETVLKSWGFDKLSGVPKGHQEFLEGALDFLRDNKDSLEKDGHASVIKPGRAWCLHFFGRLLPDRDPVDFSVMPPPPADPFKHFDLNKSKIIYQWDPTETRDPPAEENRKKIIEFLITELKSLQTKQKSTEIRNVLDSYENIFLSLRLETGEQALARTEILPVLAICNGLKIDNAIRKISELLQATTDPKVQEKLQEVLGILVQGLAPSKKIEPNITINLGEDLKWEELFFSFVDGSHIKVSARGNVSQPLHFSKLGLFDRRYGEHRPKDSWTDLITLILTGVIENRGAKKGVAISQRIKTLNEALKSFFKISENPISAPTRGENTGIYSPKFKVEKNSDKLTKYHQKLKKSEPRKSEVDEMFSEFTSNPNNGGPRRF